MAKAKYHGNGRPFSRVLAFHALVVAAIQEHASPILQQVAINKLGAYESRGHGGRHRPKAKIGFMYAIHARTWRSKYVPHQGAREIARRASRGRGDGVLHG